MINNLTIKPISLIAAFIYSVVYRYSKNIAVAKITVILIVVIISLIALFRLLEYFREKKTNGITNKDNGIKFYISIMVCLSVFMGLYIPINIIQLSPLEFFTNHRTPIQLLINTFLIYCGLFCIWMTLFYLISPRFLRKIETIFWCTYLFSGIINYFLFNRNNGFISSLLVYDKLPNSSFQNILLGTVILLVSLTLCIFIISKKNIISRITKIISFISLVFFAMSLTCLINIVGVTTRADIVMSEDKIEYEPILPLSTEGQNVVVIMLDKAVTGYIPYIFEDKSYLVEQFDGFTYYPNTLTFGRCTDLASPALYGGYEYTPLNMNKRDSETLVSKHNEALTVMPLIFSENGFSVTVCDPPYAGYQRIPDLSIYDKYPNIKAYNTSGVYLSDIEKNGDYYYDNQQQDAFFWYSVYRTINPSLERLIYNGGTYNSLKSNDFLFKPFVDEVSVLNGLSKLTDIKKDDSNNYIIMKNETTHEPAHLSIDGVEDYKLAGDIDYNSIDKTINGVSLHFYDQISYDFYVTNMIAYIELGNYFDYLREQGVYDNTKIIIVSDHGNDLGQFDDRIFSNGMDMERYSAVLMVKDYYATGFSKCDDVMSIGDVPTLATDGIIDNPINPFTKNPINSAMKKEGIIVTTSGKVSQGIGNYQIKKYDLSDGEYWKFTGNNIYDEDCWTKVN